MYTFGWYELIWFCSIIATVDLIAFCTMNNLVHLAFNFVLGKRQSFSLISFIRD